MGDHLTRVRLPYTFFFTAAWFLLAMQVRIITSSTSLSEQVRRSTYVVHMDKSRMPNRFTSPQQWYSSVVESLRTDQKNPKASSPSILHTYDHAIHGFSASLTPQELERLKKKTPGFLLASDDKTCVLDTTYTPEFISLNPSTGLWDASDYGQDVIIGVVDSGVWPESESFSGHNISPAVPSKWNGTCQEPDSSMCNNKLIGARFFNAGFIAANPNATNNNSSRDTIGHGTATTSVAAGNRVPCASYFGYAKGTAQGVAPFARVAAYKVAWDEAGLAYSSDILAGIDQAIADNVDVLLIPLGCDDIEIYDDPIAKGSFAAVEKGIVVTASAGNRGTVHNAIPWVVTVAAGTVNRWFAGTVTLGNGQTLLGWTLHPTNAFIQDSPLVYNTTLSACNSAALLKDQTTLGGAVVICDDTWPVREQITSVTAAADYLDLDGAIFISNDSSIVEEEEAVLGGKLPFPGVVIRSSSKESLDLISYVQNSSSTDRPSPSVSIDFQKTLFRIPGKPIAPEAASYTSSGPSPYYPRALKPDILAPGSQVLAAWPKNLPAAQLGPNLRPLSSDFNILSGTSIAAAHVSGVAALLKAARPEWSTSAIRSAIMTTARGRKPHTVLTIGSGQINADRALDPGLIYDVTVQDYVNLVCNDLQELTAEQIKATIRHDFDCSDLEFDELNYPSFILLHSGSHTTTHVFKRTVTNVGPAAVTSYRPKVIMPPHEKGYLNVTVTPETLEFNDIGEKRTYSVEIALNPSKGNVSFGELIWLEENGTHTVRSPIITAIKIPLRNTAAELNYSQLSEI